MGFIRAGDGLSGAVDPLWREALPSIICWVSWNQTNCDNLFSFVNNHGQWNWQWKSCQHQKKTFVKLVSARERCGDWRIKKRRLDKADWDSALVYLRNRQLNRCHIYSQGCISCVTCSYPELTEDHVLTSAYVKIFRIVTRNAVNKSFWRKKDCSWPPLNKYAMNIWLSSLRIRAHLSWRTGKHLHVLHVLRPYPTCSYPGYQDTTTYAALVERSVGIYQ